MNEKEFNVLRYLYENSESVTQRIVAEELKISLGTVNTIITNLVEEKLVTKEYKLTSKAHEELAKFKVDNAIILAAGMSTRFVPFSIEKPKGLTVVKGEVLIERQIRQLLEAGVEEIVLVLGHMMEKFLYLREKYNVKIVVNNEYRYKNTHSSMFFAKEYLKNSYVCCADNYFPKSVFHRYEYHSLYSTVFMEGIWRGERGVTSDKEGLIIDTQRPAIDQWVMNGYAFLNNKFNVKFKKILDEMYDMPGTNDLYWEQVYAEHVGELELYEKRYADDEILEFDSVQELEKFDSEYIKYNDLQIIRNICSVLNCSTADIHNIKPISKGYTNKSFSFECRDSKYVYREPGIIAAEFIDLKTEKKALEIVKELNIDDSYVYEDDNLGWKISEYIKSTEPFDFSNEKHIKLLCKSFNKLFSKSYSCGRIFDYLYEAKKLLNNIKKLDEESYNAAVENISDIEKIDRKIKNDGWEIQLTHNDIYEDNLLISNGKLFVIDWEYAGDSDIGYDLCKLFVKNEVTGEEIDKRLSYYYGRKPTHLEKTHIIMCAVVSFYYWYVWALYMTKKGNDYTDLMLKYYSIVDMYMKEYKKIGGEN